MSVKMDRVGKESWIGDVDANRGVRAEVVDVPLWRIGVGVVTNS